MATEVTPEAKGETPEVTPPATDEKPEAKEPEVAATGETLGQDAKLPDDHPLVKKLDIQKTAIAAQKAEIAELRTKSAQATKLEEDIAKLPSQAAMDTLQTRYDRLEEFLGAVGGPLSKALDSRTFTRDLFETDKDITELVKEFSKANPTATSSALGSSSAAPEGKKPSINDLLRAATH